MRERFNTHDRAVLFVDGVFVTYDNLIYRAEGISPGDCRDFFTSDEEYERMEHIVRPEHEYIVFEITLDFERIPYLFEEIAEDDRKCILSFECDGYTIENVVSRLERCEDQQVVLVGQYELPMP